MTTLAMQARQAAIPGARRRRSRGLVGRSGRGRSRRAPKSGGALADVLPVDFALDFALDILAAPDVDFALDFALDDAVGSALRVRPRTPVAPLARGVAPLFKDRASSSDTGDDDSSDGDTGAGSSSPLDDWHALRMCVPPASSRPAARGAAYKRRRTAGGALRLLAPRPRPRVALDAGADIVGALLPRDRMHRRLIGQKRKSGAKACWAPVLRPAKPPEDWGPPPLCL